MTAQNATRTTDRPGPGWAGVRRWRRPLSGGVRHGYAITFWLLSLILLRLPLSRLASLSFSDERASHVLLIPVISAVLIGLGRKRIFRAPRYCLSVGAPLLALAAVLWYGLKAPLLSLSNTDRVSAETALIILIWLAGFVLFYGTGCFRAGLFPLLLLLAMIPLPGFVAERLVSILRQGSAETCYALFRVIGVPFVRHGFQFALPGVDIEVAEQCSGIHSGLSLFIAGLLAEYALLQGTWKKACFMLCVLPIAIFKNAVRIVTIAWLGIYVSPDFLRGRLHREGGLPFALVALALMALLLWFLRRPGKTAECAIGPSVTTQA